jgi:hypothetical protein
MPRGFGMELIERGIRFELKGDATIEAVDGHLHCRIVVPAEVENLALAPPQKASEARGTS